MTALSVSAAPLCWWICVFLWTCWLVARSVKHCIVVGGSVGEGSFTGALRHTQALMSSEFQFPTCKIWQVVPYLPTTVSFLISGSAFAFLQVGFADLCNLWCGARSVALETTRHEWLRAEVTGCDNFCLADKHRQNHSSFLFSITMNYALGCQCSFMCPYSPRGLVLLFIYLFPVMCCLPFRCYALVHRRCWNSGKKNKSNNNI